MAANISTTTSSTNVNPPFTTTSSRRVNPRPRIALRMAPRERGADMVSSPMLLSGPRKRAGAFRLPALPLHFALRCAAADQQPAVLAIPLMLAGWVVVAAVYVNTHCAVLVALVT